MELTLERTENILKTLPIGIYTRHDIKVELDNGWSSTSYIDLINLVIHVSFKNIQNVVNNYYTKNNITEINDYELENFIRGFLYHEVSHAILSPRTRYNNIINIFEDERIETICKNKYEGVNFKNLIKTISLNAFEEAKNSEQYFFQIVRLDFGPKELIEEKKQLIKKYSFINPQTNEEKTDEYFEEIKEFYDKITNNFVDKTQKKEEQNELPNIQNQQNENDIQEQQNENDIQEQENQQTLNDLQNQDNEQANQIEISKEDDEDQEQLEISEKAFEQALTNLNKFEVNTLVNKLQQIISSHRSMNKANGSAINSYSGVFDPRQVIRNDYKYFLQKNRSGNIKKFSKTKLNLFIDDSGSFHGNVPFVNRLLEALEKFEKLEPNFQFDVIRCGNGQTICNKNERTIVGYDGTFLKPTIFEQFKKVQSSDANNYNIVLFDGDAFCSCNNDNRSNYYKDFLAFNTSNTYIISDLSNQQYIEMFAPKARAVFTNNYVELLYNNIFAALNTLLR